MRIVTLLPSATEIVCALGRQSDLKGVSHSCNFPLEVTRLPRVTSTRVPVERDSREIDAFVREHLDSHDALYDLDLEQLKTLRPDVIVSQALCDVCAVATGDVAEALALLPGEPQLVDLQPNTLEEVFADIERVGRALSAVAEADQLVASLRARQRAVVERSAALAACERPRVVFLEWLVPPFCGGHWNPELIAMAGGTDVLGRPGKASVTLNWNDVAEADPDVLVVSCCGFDERRAQLDLQALAKHDDWARLRAVKNARVIVVDGNAWFSSPGPRLIDGLEVLAHKLHPRVHPRPYPNA